MTKRRLLIRNLFHFRAANAALVAGMVVATAVLTGALMVGDSVRGSLRALAVERLGEVDYVLASSRFFRQDLAERMRSDARFSDFGAIRPAIQLRGGAANEAEKVRTAGVQIMGVGEEAIEARGALINGELADALRMQAAGRDIVFSFPVPDETPRDAALAQRGASAVIGSLRAKVGKIERERGFWSLFNLAGSQRPPRNAWVRLNDLQTQLDLRGRVNTLMVSGKGSASGAATAEPLTEILGDVATLDDYGLSIGQSKAMPESILASRSTFISPHVDEVASTVAEAKGIPLRRVSVYLGNRVERVSAASTRPAAIHYAILAGVSDIDGAKLGGDEIAINQWTADRLGAKAGDVIRFTFYQRQANGDLAEVSSERLGAALKVVKVLPMSGMGADPSLTPDYKGLTDAESVSDWDPPEGVDIDKTLVSKEDEDYWDKHKAAPKVFLSLEAARKLWGNVYGDINSIRFPSDRAEEFSAALKERINPAAVGMSFIAIKGQQLAAATGSTDFSGLFIGFSFFLLVAAGLFVAMLFRLSVEQRARQFGLLGSLGFTPRDIRRLTLAEGGIVAVAGGVLGVVGAMGYAWLMLAGLRTWWFSAIGTTAIELHVEPRTLLIGLAASLVIALVAATWGIRRVSRVEAATLLAGGFARSESGARPTQLFPLVSAVGFVAGLVFIVVGAVKSDYAKLAFLSGGTMLLVAGLAGVASRLQNVPRGAVAAAGGWSIVSLGTRNAGRNRGRSVLTVGLIAFASFVLITLSAMKAPPANVQDKVSGTGGFDLVMLADVPLLGDLNSPRGREILGVQRTDSPLWGQADFFSMRAWAGQDMSCLNLTQPSSPTILAAPQTLVDRGGFLFANSIEHIDNGWKLLSKEMEDPDVIPVIADGEAATYILKLGLGEALGITDQTGRPRKLKLVATLSHSIFQSELLMSEANFLRLFPTQSGFGTVLVDVKDAGAMSDMGEFLSTELADFAVMVEPAGTRLARYQEVQNTYISTFQTLGAFGLLLGTVGLAVVLIRSLVERRAELALLTAVGFPPGRRLQLVLSENVYLLVMGLIVGGGCALLGILPAVFSAGRSINITELVLTLLLVLVSGVVVMSLAVWFGGRHVTAADLRAE